ncbi:MAG: hypothetical protein AAFN70_10470 [Planctomycetota bacterium]
MFSVFFTADSATAQNPSGGNLSTMPPLSSMPPLDSGFAAGAANGFGGPSAGGFQPRFPATQSAVAPPASNPVLGSYPVLGSGQSGAVGFGNAPIYAQPGVGPIYVAPQQQPMFGGGSGGGLFSGLFGNNRVVAPGPTSGAFAGSVPLGPPNGMAAPPGSAYGPGGSYGPGAGIGYGGGLNQPFANPYPSSAYPSAAPGSLYPGGLFGSPGYGGPGFGSPMPFRILQGPRFRHTFLTSGSGNDRLQINDTDVSVAMAWANFLYGTQPLYVIPSFSLHLWEGPITDGNITADLPASAYSAFLDFTHTHAQFGTQNP